MSIGVSNFPTHCPSQEVSLKYHASRRDVHFAVLDKGQQIVTVHPNEGSTEKAINIWNAKTGEVEGSIAQEERALRVFEPSDMLVSSDDNKLFLNLKPCYSLKRAAIGVFDLKKRVMEKLLSIDSNFPEEEIPAFTISNDGKRAFVACSLGVYIFNIEQETIIGILKEEGEGTSSMPEEPFSREGRKASPITDVLLHIEEGNLLVQARRDEKVKIWNVEKKCCENNFEARHLSWRSEHPALLKYHKETGTLVVARSIHFSVFNLNTRKWVNEVNCIDMQRALSLHFHNDHLLVGGCDTVPNHVQVLLAFDLEKFKLKNKWILGPTTQGDPLVFAHEKIFEYDWDADWGGKDWTLLRIFDFPVINAKPLSSKEISVLK